MLKRYKYRAYPTRAQKEHLAQTFGCSRVVWNKYVEHQDQYSPTTKTCNNCGTIRDEPVPLSMREWECEHCKTVLGRDINAAMNILDLGIAYLAELENKNPRKVGVSLESRETQTGTSLLKQLIV